MAQFESPEMQVVHVGEELPIKLTTEGIGQKLENLIVEKLNAHETGAHILTCAEIHDLASSYAELCKCGWPINFDSPWSYNSGVDCDAGIYE